MMWLKVYNYCKWFAILQAADGTMLFNISVPNHESAYCSSLLPQSMDDYLSLFQILSLAC